VLIPEVFTEFVTTRLLGMEFVEGVKITEYASTHATEDEKKAVLSSLLNFYGYTMHGPIFNCDPHPGNLLVDRRTGKLCVLDWGQSRQLAQHERFAYAKIFMGALMEDGYLFVEGCRAIGFSFGDMEGPPDPTPAVMMGALRFVLRDSRPVAQSRADFEQLEQVFSKLSGETKAIQTGGENILKGPLMPLTKTVSLLFEVSSRLNVSLPLMHIFASHGYPMLLQELGYDVKIDPSQTSFKIELEQSTSGLSSAAGSLQTKLQSLLESLHEEGQILGAQLVVLDVASGKALVDVALGHSGWLKPLPVSHTTIFNILDISKLFLAASVLRLVEKGAISLGTALGGKAEETVTLEHALAHTAGLFQLVPRSVESFRDLCNLNHVTDTIAQEQPLLPPGTRQQYHYTIYGWLLASACRKAGSDIQSAFDDFMAAVASSMSLKAPLGEFAEPNKQMKSPSINDFAADMSEFEFFVDVTERGKRAEASMAEKADGAYWMSMFGRDQWFEPSALNGSLAKASILPGLQAFATARSTCEALRGMATGKALGSATLEESLRSRKPNAGGASASPPIMPKPFKQFEKADWGLGIQLVPLPGREAAWGHQAGNGSFALVLPGEKPMAAALLLNRSDGGSVAERVLAALTELN